MKKEELWKKYKRKDTREEKDSYLASLSDKDFYNMMTLPIGNITRTYLTGFRKVKQNSNLNKYIIHIPHASLEILPGFKKRLTISYYDFQRENKFISDYLVDRFLPDNFNNVVKFKYSRMLCDVERYLDDNQEEMSKYGMGVLYTKDSNGKVFVNREKDEEWIVNLYKRHHEELDNMVADVLNKKGDCFIIDLHSFSDEFVEKVFHKKDNPDICLGFNQSNYDKKLLIKTISHFKKYGYSVKINYPYSGSIISNRYPNVKSMMIEINKRIYLSNRKDYDKLYDCMMDYYKLLKRNLTV